MWWLLRHGNTQRRRIRYIGKINNRVCMEKFKRWRHLAIAERARRREKTLQSSAICQPRANIWCSCRSKEWSLDVLTPQILDSVFRLRRLAGCAAHQVLREIMSAVLMDFFAQPLQKRLITALGQVFGEIRHLSFGCIHQLSSIQITEGVSREIAQCTVTPMHILKNPAPIVWYLQIEKLLKLGIPGFGQVFYFQSPLNQIQFDLKSKQNVEIVCYFVRFNPNKRGSDPLNSSGQVIWRITCQIW